MKTAFFALFLSLSALAQNTNPWPDACGPRQTKFDVDRDWYLARHFTPATPAGKATIYFIERDSGVVKVGIDGAWVGATNTGSWFAVTVDPGRHRVCEYTTGSAWDYYVSHPVQLADVDAHSGESYYFRAWMSGYVRHASTFHLETISAHDGNRLIAKYPLSVFQAKKAKKKK